MNLLHLFLILGTVFPSPERWRQAMPPDATIVETARLVSSVHPNRLLVLWMRDAVEDGRDIDDDEPYTCPDQTRGSRYLRGNAAVSLVDLARDEILNTVVIDREGLQPQDSRIELPLRIRRGLYAVSAASGEARPAIMDLRDWNGDGLPHEFSLYEADSCSLLFGTLVGYSERRDRVIWYEVVLRVTEDNQILKPLHSHWSDGLFQARTCHKGRCVFMQSYSSEGPRQFKFDIHYNAGAERFEGTETIVELGREIRPH